MNESLNTPDAAKLVELMSDYLEIALRIVHYSSLPVNRRSIASDGTELN